MLLLNTKWDGLCVCGVTVQAVPVSQYRLCQCHSTDCASVTVQTVPVSQYRLCQCHSTDCASVTVQTVPVSQYRLCQCHSTDCASVTVQTVPVSQYRLCQCHCCLVVVFGAWCIEHRTTWCTVSLITMHRSCVLQTSKLYRSTINN